MKKCTKCGEFKDESFFNKRKQSKDGLRYDCRECQKVEKREYYRKNKDKTIAQQRVYRAENKDKIAVKRRVYRAENREATREIDREWRKKNPEAIREKNRKWRKSNPHKRKAHMAVSYALEKGTLKKEPCVICGEEKVDAHHENYSKPLEVIWLCRKHHRRLHDGHFYLIGAGI